MRSINVHEAKTHFSALLKRVEGGEEVVIARAGRPIARLVPAGESAERPLGSARDMADRVWIADDFDRFVPEEWREYIE